MGVGAVAALLALGARLDIAGHATGVTLPGAWIAWLGPQNLYRLAGLTTACALAAAALGLRRCAWWAPLVLAEGLFAAPLAARVPTVADPVGELEAWLADREGAVIDLPLELLQRSAPADHEQRNLMLQTGHGLPIASSLYLAPTRIDGADLVHIDRCVSEALELDLPTEALVAAGFRWVVLDTEGLRDPERSIQVLQDWLGPAELEVDQRSVWALEPATAPR
jgi:hypothetical protein